MNMFPNARTSFSGTQGSCPSDIMWGGWFSRSQNKRQIEWCAPGVIKQANYINPASPLKIHVRWGMSPMRLQLMPCSWERRLFPEPVENISVAGILLSVDVSFQWCVPRMPKLFTLCDMMSVCCSCFGGFICFTWLMTACEMGPLHATLGDVHSS